MKLYGLPLIYYNPKEWENIQFVYGVNKMSLLQKILAYSVIVFLLIALAIFLVDKIGFNFFGFSLHFKDLISPLGIVCVVVIATILAIFTGDN